MAYDISRIYLRFDQCPEGVRLVDHFEELQAFPEFKNVSDDKIKIAILLGDIDSPFIRIKDRDTMLRSVFDFLSIDAKINIKLLQDIIQYRDDEINSCWVRYIQILHETDFTDWLLCKRDYDYFLQKSNEPHDKEKESDDRYLATRNKLRQTIRDLGQQVREIEAKLFPDSKAAREAAIAEAKNKIKLYAESYAEPYAPY